MLRINSELYRESEYRVEDRLPAACDFGEHTVSLGVMSKTYGLPGLRIGWINFLNGTPTALPGSGQRPLPSVSGAKTCRRPLGGWRISYKGADLFKMIRLSQVFGRGQFSISVGDTLKLEP